MSVIIKGMKMPTNCDLCPLHCRYTTEVGCKITGSRYAVSSVPFASHRMADCPALEIQTLYGRLIDADALEKKIEKHLNERKIDRYDRDLLLHYLDVEAAPTTIEAEEE